MFNSSRDFLIILSLCVYYDLYGSNNWFTFVAGSGGSGSESDVDMVVEPRERDGIRRAAASKAKAKYADSGRLDSGEDFN